MKHSKNKNKFSSEQNSREYERSKTKTYEWVPKYQIIAAAIIIFQCMYFASITEDWKGYLSNLVAIAVLYFIVSGIFERITMYIETRDKKISSLRRQLTGFICDASLGKVPEADLQRIAVAANDLLWRNSQDDLSKDDFNLLSRTWFFWKNQNGFNWQDEIKCTNCGQERKAHSREGHCPTSTE